jgi:hypothetical protein
MAMLLLLLLKKKFFEIRNTNFISFLKLGSALFLCSKRSNSLSSFYCSALRSLFGFWFCQCHRYVFLLISIYTFLNLSVRFIFCFRLLNVEQRCGVQWTFSLEKVASFSIPDFLRFSIKNYHLNFHHHHGHQVFVIINLSRYFLLSSQISWKLKFCGER